MKETIDKETIAVDDKMLEQIDAYYDFWFQINDIYRIWAQKHNTNETTVFILQVIDTGAPFCTQNEIGSKLFLPKQTVSIVLSGLEKKGYIVREPNPSDRRNKIVKFTEQGARYARGLLDELKAMELEAFASIAPEKRLAISETFALLAGSLSKASHKTSCPPR
ncbi:MarR family transcriptional regulator [Desulfitobacterium sp. LBE]|uniref:Transcriptional regulator, MarR family n=1 Tax=Desulfitobacterium hafniense (strain DSM 10664 / DCB-2) TaxID=272564 RepID=B8FRY3_DESHD|nr:MULTISPECIES: MarR family transcriptional regulator [Desulfitobacterium]ACL20121.1 transcriptional regulator, MarR family [Desulfitobacterium hafniense DCB-2]TWH57037.1 MarR family transcriptional regulator [Desulfitobacterium sp. LBE]